MLDNIHAVIFDLDGTLVDSMWLWKQIDIDYFAKFNIVLPDTLQSEIEGMSFTETAHYIKNKFRFPDTIEQMKNTWNEMALHKYRYEVPFKEGIPKFLSYCKKNNIKLAIATSNSRELVDAVGEALDFDMYFDCIMTACEVERGKPSPDIYLAVSKKLNITPNECLVFEDIVPGIMAGLNAGMKVCAVEDDYSKKQKEEKMRLADYYIKDYNDISLT